MTAYSPVNYSGDGATIDFTFSWDYIDDDHVKVFVDSAETADFSLPSPGIVRFQSPPANNATIEIRRETPPSPLEVTWNDGSVILGDDLNKAVKQAIFVAEEASIVRTVILNWKGTWADATTYEVNDAVELDGSSYVCIQEHTADSTTEPGVGASWSSHWDILASKGDTGATGPGSGDMLSTNNLSDVASAATAFNNIKQAASETATGVVERATQAEVDTGTDTARFVTPATLKARTDLLLPLTGGTLTGDLIIAKPSGWTTFTLDATAGNRNVIEGRKGGSPRWIMSMASSVAETGGNVGSNFVLSRYSDAGSWLNSTLVIWRDTGFAEFEHRIRGGSLDPSHDNDLARKKYVDDEIAGIDTGGWVFHSLTAANSATHLFSSIPTDVMEVQITWSHVSSNGTADFLVQIGDAGGIETAGYNGVSHYSTAAAAATNGFPNRNANAGVTVNGVCTLRRATPTSNQWMIEGSFWRSNSNHVQQMGGEKTLSGNLDRVQVSANGATFDNGWFHVNYR